MRKEPYIDEDYYKKEFEGETVETADFPRFSKRASDVVDQLTGYEIAEKGLDSYEQFIKGLVKRATAAQVEYYQIEGIEIDTTGQSENDGFSLSKLSVSSNSSQTSRQSKRVAPNTLSYLEATGLVKRKRVRLSVI